MNARFQTKDSLAQFVEKAELSRAVEYQNQNSVRKFANGVYARLSYFCSSAHDFNQFGVGLELYFHFIRWLAVLFLLISGISILPMYLNSTGSQISEDTQQEYKFSILSLGNEDNSDRWFLILLADLVYSGLFIAFLFFYRLSAQRIVANDGKNVNRLTNYAVQVKKLPRNCLETEVKTHFQQFGEVLEVRCARKYDDKLYDYRKRAELSYKLGEKMLLASQKGKETTPAIKLLRIRIQHFDAKIANKEKSNLKPFDQLPVDRAFVVFNLTEDRDKCLRQYKQENKWWRSSKKQRKELKFKGEFPLRVKPAPEPSIILWENLEITYCKKLVRTVFITLVTFALLIGSVALVFWVKSRESDLPTYLQCKANCSIPLQETTTCKTPVDCFCAMNSLQAIISGNTECVQNVCHPLQPLCDDYLSKWRTALYTKLLSCLGIIFINFFLLLTLKTLTAIERPPTIDKLKGRLLNKVFLAMFVNTTIITVLVNATFPNISTEVFRGNYGDFVSDWYLTVGATITITLFINVFSPHCLILLVFRTIKQCRRLCCWRRVQTQQELNLMFVGPEFDLAVKHAIVLNLVFSCFLYSGGMPILNAICFLGLFLIYWVEKFLVLNYYHKPPAFNERLNAQAMNILPMCVILHCAVSLYMYGYFNNLPTMDRRITSTSGYLLILFMIIACGIGFFSYVILRLYYCCRGALKRKEQKPALLDILEQMKREGCSSYNILDNEAYLPLIQAMNSVYIRHRNETTELEKLPMKQGDNEEDLKIVSVSPEPSTPPQAAAEEEESVSFPSSPEEHKEKQVPEEEESVSIQNSPEEYKENQVPEEEESVSIQNNPEEYKEKEVHEEDPAPIPSNKEELRESEPELPSEDESAQMNISHLSNHKLVEPSE